MSAQLALALPCAAPSNCVVINARCSLHIEEDQRVIVVAGLPVHHYRAEDAVAEAYAMVFLVEAGFAQQREVAHAFGRSERTVRRYQERYAQGGMAALRRAEGWRRGRRRIRGKRLRSIERLKSEGLSNRAIAQRLGVTERAIRKLVGTSKSPQAEQLDLAAIASAAASEPSPVLASVTSTDTDTHHEAASVADDQAVEFDDAAAQDEPLPLSLDRDASDRSVARQLAHLGMLDDAAPLFRDGSRIPGVGVLLALPALVESGLLRISRKLYGEIGPAFYGLRTSLLTLLFMALLRIKRPEHLKEHDPAALGRLLGLDRVPEVKTLRRKLSRLAAYQRAEPLGAELAQAMPATTDYWINDRAGDPLLVITGEVNSALTRAFPRLLREVRGVFGERRVTIVFDRGGWSPKLFHKMIDEGFDILTYRTGKARRIHERRFVRRRARLDGHWVSYDLHEQPVRFLKGKLRLRQITRLCDNGHQTQIITSRLDLRDIEIAWRMFERWRQENFFKYMREEFLLDALVDYRIEAEDPTRTIPNPERRVLDKQIRSACSELSAIERAYGAAVANNIEQKRRTMRGFKIAHGKLGKKLRAARARLTKLIAQRRAVAARVEIRDLSEGAVVKLATERKHLTDIIKMVAYQTESDLLALLRPHYGRAEQEGRTLLHEIFAAAGDIRVSDTELHITLAPLSSPHRTHAAQALCEVLDQTATVFPGSRLRIRFTVHPPPRIGLAFPGSPPEFRAPSAHTSAS